MSLGYAGAMMVVLDWMLSQVLCINCNPHKCQDCTISQMVNVGKASLLILRHSYTRQFKMLNRDRKIHYNQIHSHLIIKKH